MKRLLFLLLCLATTARAQERTLSLREAVTMALEKNGDVIVERESLAIAEADQQRAAAAYEPVLRGDLRFRSRTDAVNSILSGAPEGEPGPTTRSIEHSASLTQLLRNGATLTVFSSFDRDSTDSTLARLTPAWSTSAGAEIRQPLMQNRRIDPARHAIRIAAVDRSRAESSVRRAAAETVAATEHAYWNLAAARSAVGIRESALHIAEVQRGDTRVRIEAGTQAGSDLAQTTAEVERRRGELVSAIEGRTRAENALRALIAQDAADPIWNAPVVPSDSAAALDAEVNVDEAIQHALARRPELEELTLRLARHDIEIESSIDRVRPRLDLVASYTTRGLTGDDNENALVPFPGFSSTGGTAHFYENEFPDASVGVSFALPIGNTAAKQDVAIARAQRRRSETTLEDARKQVAVEVRNAVAAITSAAQRIDATAAAREAAEIQLRAERDRFDAGASNNFFVLTRQNDLAAAQLAEIVAITDYQNARSELARATGNLVGTLADKTGGSV